MTLTFTGTSGRGIRPAHTEGEIHMARAVGIDLGTTNSVVSVLEGGGSDGKAVAAAERFHLERTR